MKSLYDLIGDIFGLVALIDSMGIFHVQAHLYGEEKGITIDIEKKQPQWDQERGVDDSPNAVKFILPYGTSPDPIAAAVQLRAKLNYIYHTETLADGEKA